MYNLIVAAVVFMMTSAPGGDWSKADKDAFMEECNKEAAAMVGTDKANDYCSCMLVRVIDAYPNSIDALNMDMETVTEWAGECIACQWTTTDVNTFMDECIVNAKGDAGEDFARGYCSCMFSQLIVVYPDPNSIDQLTEDIINDLAGNCF